MYVQFGSHIDSMIYVKYVLSAHCYMVDCSDFICGTNMCIHYPCKSIKYLSYMACAQFGGIFISNTYLAITWKVWIAVGCVLAQMCKLFGLYAHSVCWLCDLHVWCSSHICSVIYAYMELMLHIEQYTDNCYTHLPLYEYLDNLHIYTNVIILFCQNKTFLWLNKQI